MNKYQLDKNGGLEGGWKEGLNEYLIEA